MENKIKALGELVKAGMCLEMAFQHMDSAAALLSVEGQEGDWREVILALSDAAKSEVELVEHVQKSVAEECIPWLCDDANEQPND